MECTNGGPATVGVDMNPTPGCPPNVESHLDLPPGARAMLCAASGSVVSPGKDPSAPATVVPPALVETTAPAAGAPSANRTLPFKTTRVPLSTRSACGDAAAPDPASTNRTSTRTGSARTNMTASFEGECGGRCNTPRERRDRTLPANLLLQSTRPPRGIPARLLVRVPLQDDRSRDRTGRRDSPRFDGRAGPPVHEDVGQTIPVRVPGCGQVVAEIVPARRSVDLREHRVVEARDDHHLSRARTEERGLGWIAHREIRV